MWAWWASLFSFQTKSIRKRPAAAAALTPDRSDCSAKKPRQDAPAAPRALSAPVATATAAKADYGLRSIAAAHKDRDVLMSGAGPDMDICAGADLGIPVGPYETEEQLIQAI